MQTGSLKTISILGCGWLGLPLAAALISDGYIVQGSTSQKEKFPVLENAGIQPFLIHCNPEYQSTGRNDFFQSDILIITLPFKRSFKDTVFYERQMKSVLTELKKFTKINFVIFTSSTSVYPDSLAEAREDRDFVPDNARSATLLAVEKMLMNNSNFETTILRMAGLYGPGRPIGRFLAGQTGLIDGDKPVNLIHLDDCVRIITQIIKQDIRAEVLNACADQHPTRKQLYTTMAQKMGLKIPEFLPVPSSCRKIVSNQKLKARLKYRFLYPDPLQT